MIKKHSLTFRLTSLFSIVTIIMIGGLCWQFNTAFEAYIFKQNHQFLKDKIAILQEVVNKNSRYEALLITLKNIEETEDIKIKLTHTSNNQLLYQSKDIEFPQNTFTTIPTIESPRTEHLSLKTLMAEVRARSIHADEVKIQQMHWEFNKHQYQGISFNLPLNNASDSSVDIVLSIDKERSLDYIQQNKKFLLSLQPSLITFAIIASFISALLAWLVTYYGLLPLRALSKQAISVSGKDIKHRMPVNNLPVEVSQLSETLNNMLQRLESSFKRLDNFSSDIAHELRTPINNLMVQTQVILSKPQTNAEYQSALISNLEEFESMSRMIADMLFIAKADNQQLLLCSESIKLHHEISEVFDFYDALAEEHNLRLIVKGDAQLNGDKQMLRRAFSNLLSNAIHYGFADSEVIFDIQTSAKSTVINVSNCGATIPPQELAHLFKRFYRSDQARTHHNNEHVGLGLAITKSIIEAHGGNIVVKSENEVTTFTLTFN